jgi:hypothetical protein
MDSVELRLLIFYLIASSGFSVKSQKSSLVIVSMTSPMQAHWLAGAANDTYCWLKHGVYEQCDDALFTNIGLEVEKNKTDNDTFFDAVIPSYQ